MRKFSSGLVLLFVLLTTRTWATPLPQDEEKSTTEATEDEEEEEEEGEDEYYGDEDKGTSTSKPKVEVSEEELDKDDLEDLALRQELSQRLGIKNYTASAITDKATQTVLAFIASRYGKESSKTPPPKKKGNQIRTTTVKSAPFPITTRKYKILRSTPTPFPRADIISSNSTNVEATRTFLITVPQDKIGSGGGGLIEISIPKNVTSEILMTNDEDTGSHHHLSQMSILGQDEQGVKNIEAAIMEALLIAQQVTGMKMSTVMSGDNKTETIELDIKEMPEVATEILLENQTVSNSETNATELVVSSESPQRSEGESDTQKITEVQVKSLPSSVAQEPEVTSTQKPKLRSTTPKGPKIPDPLGLGPLTDLFVSQIRNGKLPTFIWGSIIKLSNSKYAKIAVDAVECAVFYYCPDDTELGTLSEGAKF